MSDIWSFLLQTLTATGVAFLLFGIKAIFFDKLSPRWQFAIWGVLAVILLLPAGWGGRYVLTNWPLAVEALKSALTGEFGTLARVIAPIPLPPPAPPKSAADWAFLVYAAGAAFLLLRYLASYIRLRLLLKRGRPAQNERVRAVGARYRLPTCPAVEVDGLPTAFICGVFKPVLALPAGVGTDEKVILHELLHLKYKDVVWSWVICLFRCVHWCNPFIWVCDCWARSDLEALCDQRALERLEGEERRDYGRILLSMVDGKYAHAPGTSSAANGGKNIRRRIEAIARFKRYPAGMALVSVCMALVLAFPLLMGARAEELPRTGNRFVRMASARTTWCTTYAGAFDAYAKGALMGNPSSWAMCAPLSQQNELAAELFREDLPGPDWAYFGLDDIPWIYPGYTIYNLAQVGADVWEGLLVLTLMDAPEGEEWDGSVHGRWLAVQPLRAEKEGERWVILPQGPFQAVQGDERSGGNLGLPAWVYEGQYGDFTIRVQWQTTACVNSTVRYNEWSSSYDADPKPHGEFDQTESSYMVYALYNGDSDKWDEYSHIRVCYTPVYEEPAGTQHHSPVGSGGIGLDGIWAERNLAERNLREYWGEVQDDRDLVFLDGGGRGYEGPGAVTYQLPAAYAVDLYLNGEFAAELTLLPEGGGWIGR